MRQTWFAFAALVLFTVPAWAQPFLYVTNRSDDTVSVIDTSTNTVIETIAVGRTPQGVECSADGTRAYVANNDDDTLSIIDTISNTVIDTLTMSDGPRGVAADLRGGSKVYVTNRVDTDDCTFTGDPVGIIDTTMNAVVGSITVGSEPFGITFNNAGTRAYVSNAGPAYSCAADAQYLPDTVSVIDTATDTVVATVTVGDQPRGIAVDATDSHVYVANRGKSDFPGGTDPSVSVIDTITNMVIDTIAMPGGAGSEGPFGVAANPTMPRVYVSDKDLGTVSVIDTNTNTIVATIPIGSDPRGMSLPRDGSRLYVSDNSSDVLVVDTTTNMVIDTIAVGSSPMTMGKALCEAPSVLEIPVTGDYGKASFALLLLCGGLAALYYRR